MNFNTNALKVSITFFPDQFCNDKKEELIAWSELCRQAKQLPTYISKKAAPWIKLAKFGNLTKEGLPQVVKNGRLTGCLRNNLNLNELSGVVLDFDEIDIPPGEAQKRLEEENVAAIIYTSASHNPETSYYRIIAPTSVLVHKDEHDKLIARINGLMAGTCSNETWTLSQAYFWGRVEKDTHFETLICEGDPIDLCEHLDEGAVYKKNKSNHYISDHATYSDYTPKSKENSSEYRKEMLEQIYEGKTFYTALRGLAMMFANGGASTESICDQLYKIMDKSKTRGSTKWTERFNGIDHLAKTAFNKPNKPPPPQTPIFFEEAKPGDKPRILMEPGKLEPICREAEHALVLSNTGFYQNADIICRLNTDDSGPRLTPVSANNLLMYMSQCADWYKPGKDNGPAVIADPKENYIRILADLKGDYKYLQKLEGFSFQPFFRPDGSLVLEPGLDEATHIYASFDTKDYEHLTGNFSKEDASSAYSRLQKFFAEFCFAKTERDTMGYNANEVAAISGLMTGVIRKSLPTAPAFHINANMAGSGKTLLSLLMALGAAATPVAVTSFPNSDDEFEKRIIAQLIEGAPVIIFDNLMIEIRAYGSLCSITTYDRFTGRILGVSKMAVNLSTRILLLFSANNHGPVLDMKRRVIEIMLEQFESKRVYKNKTLLDEARANRAKIVSDCLIIMLAYQQNGKDFQAPEEVPSYIEWSRQIRNALLWLNLPDPAFSMQDDQKVDEKTQILLDLLVAWHDVYGEALKTCSEVVGEMKNLDLKSLNTSTKSLALKDALDAVPVFGKPGIDPTILGRYIGSKEKHYIRGHHFRRPVGNPSKVRWQVIKNLD